MIIRNKIPSLVILTSFIIFCSCNSSTNKSKEENEAEQVIAEQDNDQAIEGSKEKESSLNEQEMDNQINHQNDLHGIKLSGVYTTSTKMPHKKYSFAHLFDGNTRTFWETMTGAGPDEGIMLYFEEPLSISEITINQKKGSAYATIERVEIFTNGSPAGIYGLSSIIEAPSERFSEVKSLYIKFDRVSDTEFTEKFDGNYMRNTTFNPNKSVAINEITLANETGLLKLIAPKVIEGTLTASSTLSPNEAYGIHNLMDSHKEFAYVEGAEGNGIGETITASLKEATKITGIVIHNGFQRSEKHFTANSRVKELLVKDENGNKNILLIKDQSGKQIIPFPQPLNGKEITLTIQNAYNGSSYQDLVISELKFLQGNNLLVVADNSLEEEKKALINKSTNTVLENILDKRIDYNEGEMDGYESTFILRSDYTFVSYNEERESDQVYKETISDGNWEIRELDTNKAVIRVFGKLTNISTTIDYYAGNSSESYSQIFQDFVTIDKNQIIGEKFIKKHKILSTDE
jgi:hypothetical protein